MELSELRLFVEVARNKSFVIAADNCDMPASTVSRKIRLLEEELNVRLLERTTRKVTLTSQGSFFLSHCESLLQQADDMCAQLQKEQHALSGSIVACGPGDFFQQAFVDIIHNFTMTYPKITLELLTSGRNYQLLEDQVDLFFHIGKPKNSSLIAKLLAEARSSYFASPKYLQAYGCPELPEDLMQHRCLAKPTNEEPSLLWQFPGHSREFLPVRPVIATDTIACARELAVLGNGIIRAPEFLCREQLNSKALVPVFGDRYRHSISVYAMYPSRRFVPARVRLFLNYLLEHIPKVV